MEDFLAEDNIYLLKLLDEKDSEYLERLVDGRNLPEPERPSQRKMIEAKEYFEKCLVEFKSESTTDPVDAASTLKKLWDTILGLEIMVYVVDADNPEKATLIFDSVNDRGRALSTFDKTKSFLMRTAYLAAEDEDEGQSIINQIRQGFGQMYDDHQRMLNSPYIDDISDDAVQRYHYITFADWSSRQDHQTPTFLNNLKAHIRTLREEDSEACLNYISRYTTGLENAFSDLGDILSHNEEGEIADLIERIHQLRHATKFYPLLLKSWANLDTEDRSELLSAIETHIFRVYAIGNHPTYTGRSSLQTLSRDTPKDAPIDVWMSGIVTIMNKYEDDNQFDRTLSSSNLYTNVTSQDLRYLFYFYNEHRAKQEGETGSIGLKEAMSESYTIEHIWPQSPDTLPIYGEGSGEYPSIEERYEAYKHRLGNLTLASKAWNSKWGNADFQTKKEDGYEKSKLWVQWDVGEYKEWSIENIENREALLKEYVIDTWPTPDTRLSEVDGPKSAVSHLTKQERFVLQALCKTPGGGARRVIHRTASKLDGSPFESPESNGAERSTVGSILARLVSVGLAERNQATWYPSDEMRGDEVDL